MSALDNPPNPVHTSPVTGEGSGVLYRVFKMRRRDRRGRPWILWWEDPPGAGRCKTLQIGPMSERMAERHREAWQAEMNGFREDETSVRWADFRDRFLAAAGADLKPATVAIYRQVLSRFENAVSPRMLADVGCCQAEEYRVARLREVSQETARKDIRHLRAALAWAVDKGLIAVNPFDRVRFGRRETFDVDAMTVADAERFLAGLEKQPTWIWASLRLACLWGPRAGELAGILREDLDLAGQTLRLPATRRRGSPKGGRGRVIPLDGDTAGLLQELSHRDGPILWGPPAEPFTTGRGRGGYTRTLGARCRELLAGLGVVPRDDKPLQFLRRTAETNMRRRGVPEEFIGRILGHGSRVGREYYDGRSPEELARQVARLMAPWVTRGSPRPAPPPVADGPAGA